MKIRNGFVSNSSSSSFIVLKNDIGDIQEFIVRNYIRFVGQSSIFPYHDYVDDWCMEEDERQFSFYTHMDNFDLIGFFEGIGIFITEEWHS